MKKLVQTFTLISGILASLFSCIQIYPIVPNELIASKLTQTNSNRPCLQTPPIEQNIVGTWQAESTYKSVGLARLGTISFDTKGTITDVNAVFEDTISSGLVLSKVYQFAANS